MWADLECSPKQPLERIQLRRGTRMRAQIRPHVIETLAGLVEMADLFFEDGTAARNIPFCRFAFTE
jgi:hypothetical protein